MTAPASGEPSATRKRARLRRPVAWYLRQLSRVMNALTDEELERLIPHLSERRFEPRQFLFSAGEPPERVFLLLKGRVKLYHVAANGKEVILDVAGKGELVGDMAIIEGAERATCARSRRPWPSASRARTSSTWRSIRRGWPSPWPSSWRGGWRACSAPS